MKKFAKEYIVKIVRKLEKSGQRPNGSSSTSHLERDASASTKHSPHDEEQRSPAEDAMDVSEDHEHSDGEGSTRVPSLDDTSPTGKESQYLDLHSLHSKPDFLVTDPRIRHRREDAGWDDGSERPRGLPGLHDLSITS